jgi:gamma-glutamyltranspeptidase
MLVRFADGRTTTDFRECAPAAATRDMVFRPAGKPTDDSVAYTAPRVPELFAASNSRMPSMVPWAD